MAEIADHAEARGISEIVHFTTNRGLIGCLHTGTLLSRQRLPKEQNLAYILTLNSKFRKEAEPWFDQSERWIDFVNMSVSEITTNLFKASLRWHAGKDLFWVILGFDPEILDDESVYFSTTNNIYTGTLRKRGIEGFEDLFAPKIHRYGSNSVQRGSRPDHLTTCEQAEVLYPGKVDMATLKRVYVTEGELADRVSAMLAQYDRRDVNVVVDTAKFEGQGN